MSLKFVAGVAGKSSPPSPAPLPSAPLGAAVDNSVVDTVDTVDNYPMWITEVLIMWKVLITHRLTSDVDNLLIVLITIYSYQHIYTIHRIISRIAIQC